MDLDRVPVVIGGGQHTNRIEDPTVAPDPFALMELAATAAADDAGQRGVLGRLTHVWVVNSLSVRHHDPGGELARRLAADPADARYTGVGGSVPQWLVNRAAELVAAGHRPVVLIAGAEALATRRRAKKAGVRLAWPRTDEPADLWPPLEADFGLHRVEIDHGLSAPTHMYALIETAIAHARGHDTSAHLGYMARLMDRFNAVAASNPLSWFTTRRNADELATVDADNRLVCFPYPKYLNAVMEVDMAAAMLVTDAATARDLGLAAGDVAHVAGWADAKELWWVSERPELHRSPAIAACGRAALETAGMRVDDLSAFDLYSCFPSAVEVATDAIGVALDDPRPLTLTGGLPYHGGPGNNYVSHAIVNALARVRSGDDERVLVHGNGYYLTKHAVGVYTSRPPSSPPIPPSGIQAHLDAAACPVAIDTRPSGAAEVVAYTVPFERDGSSQAGVVMLSTAGGRALALADRELTAALCASDMVGAAVAVTPGEPTNTARLA